MFKNLLVARVKVAPYLISVLLFNKIKVNFKWKCELIISFAGSAGYFLFFFSFFLDLRSVPEVESLILCSLKTSLCSWL